MFALSVTLISVVAVIVASTTLILTTSAESRRQREFSKKIEALTAITSHSRTAVSQENQKKQTIRRVKSSKIFLNNR
jgi:hypothetical protein